MKRLTFITIVAATVFNQGWCDTLDADEWTPRTMVATVQLENTKPTGGLLWWHLLGSGAVCSADVDSPFSRTLVGLDGYKVRLTFSPPEPPALKR